MQSVVRVDVMLWNAMGQFLNQWNLYLMNHELCIKFRFISRFVFFWNYYFRCLVMCLCSFNYQMKSMYGRWLINTFHPIASDKSVIAVIAAIITHTHSHSQIATVHAVCAHCTYTSTHIRFQMKPFGNELCGCKFIAMTTITYHKVWWQTEIEIIAAITVRLPHSHCEIVANENNGVAELK